MDTGREVLHGSSKFHQRTELGGSTLVSACRRGEGALWLRTFTWAIEPDIEFLHAIVYQRDFII